MTCICNSFVPSTAINVIGTQLVITIPQATYNNGDVIYLYLAQPSDYDKLPDELKKMFGKGIFMLRFDLYPTRKIAKVKAQDVITALENQGYFLRIDSVDERDNLLNADRKRRGLDVVHNAKLV